MQGAENSEVWVERHEYAQPHIGFSWVVGEEMKDLNREVACSFYSPARGS